MLKRFKVFIVIASLAITLSLMSNTYSRYIASSDGNVEIEFAKWQILVDNTDVTDSTISNLEFEPIIDTNSNVAANKVAPTSTGYFDVEIDPTNVDVSFNYSISLGFSNNLLDENNNQIEISDLIITEYAIIPEDYIENEDGLKRVTITDSKISNNMLYSKGGFKPFTIRVFFKWIEKIDEGATMTDEQDTAIGLAAAAYEQTMAEQNIQTEQTEVIEPTQNSEENDSTEEIITEDITEEIIEETEAAFKINAEIKFEQIISLD